MTSGEDVNVIVGSDGQPNTAGGGGGSGADPGGSGCNGGGGGSSVDMGIPTGPEQFQLEAAGGGGDGCAGSNALVNDPATQGGDAGSAGSAGPNPRDGGGGTPPVSLGQFGAGGAGGVGSENSGASGNFGGQGGSGPCGTDGCGGSGGGGGGGFAGFNGAGGGSGGEGMSSGFVPMTYAGSGGGGAGGESNFTAGASISLADAPFVTISWPIPPPKPRLKLINCRFCSVVRLRMTVPAPGVINERQVAVISHGPRLSTRHSQPKPLIKPTRVTVSTAGTVTLKIRLTAHGKQVLKRKGKVRVKVRITYTPTGGQSVSKTIKVTFRLRGF